MYCYKLCNMFFFFNNNLKICSTKGSNRLSSFQCMFQKHIGTASLCWLLCFVFIFTSFSLFPLICCTCLGFFTHVFPTTQINVCVYLLPRFSLCLSVSAPVILTQHLFLFMDFVFCSLCGHPQSQSTGFSLGPHYPHPVTVIT